jgi:hypothetical protein
MGMAQLEALQYVLGIFDQHIGADPNEEFADEDVEARQLVQALIDEVTAAKSSPARAIALAREVLAEHGCPPGPRVVEGDGGQCLIYDDDDAFVRRFCDVSTAHLMPETLLNLSDFGSEDQWGVWIWVPTDIHENPHHFSPDIVTVLLKARELGCGYVRIDADAPEHADLPVYSHA